MTPNLQIGSRQFGRWTREADFDLIGVRGVLHRFFALSFYVRP
jgi:hypothetical protein